MSPGLVASLLICYFLALIIMAWFTSRKADTNTFFTGNRQSPWYLVAFGMIGTSLSGVTFVSVPGKVGVEGMAYFQIVLGYILGYIVIAQVLMPLYYKMNLVSIYEYLLERFGKVSYKTGAAFFIVSRTLGSAIRLYLATVILQMFLFDGLGVPYWITACTTILLIWVYTFKGGVKTIVYTDAFQTIFLVGAVALSIVVIANALDISFVDLYNKITTAQSEMGQSMTKMIHLDDYKSTLFFPKQFLGGMFIAIAMTGLDQDLMQKNLTCKSIGDAQKNMYSFTTILVICNFLFLFLGGALFIYAQQKGVDLPLNAKGGVVPDEVYPTLAFGDFGTWAGVFFLLGITASSYASADSALTALTTGFCIDFLDFKRREEKDKKRLKLIVHISFSALFLFICLIMHQLNVGRGLIDVVLGIAGYTYGPLLGLFFFGILTKRKPKEFMVPIICLVMPTICYFLAIQSPIWFNGYKIGLEMILINGIFTFLGLWAVSKPASTNQELMPEEVEEPILDTPILDVY